MTLPNMLGPSGVWSPDLAIDFTACTEAQLEALFWRDWYTASETQVSPPVNSSELEYYDPLMAFVTTAGLTLRAQPTSKPQYGKNYMAGMVQTSGKYTFDPTRTDYVIQFTAKLCPTWIAAWILSAQDASGQKGLWPPEIDIIERLGSQYQAHLHSIGGDINLGEPDDPSGVDLTAGFHTYTTRIGMSAITFWLDGVQAWTYTNTSEISSGIVVDAPFYLLFNNAVASPISAPQDFIIKDLQTWKLVSNTGSTTIPASGGSTTTTSGSGTATGGIASAPVLPSFSQVLTDSAGNSWTLTLTPNS